MARKSIQPSAIPASSLEFLKLLKKNNNRDWFNLNKERFLAEQECIEKLADILLAGLNATDVIETASGKKSLYRIYRDTRFSKEKTPYKTHWSGSFTRAGKQRRGGYYFHIEPGNSFVAGGFWGPEPADLKRIREELAFDARPLRKILSSKSFVSTFGKLEGEQVKTTPKGFDASNEAIDLLRYKQYLLIRRFSDDEVLDPSFPGEAVLTFTNMRPFFDYMSEVLGTDNNGISIY
jgi:uncharacterized protein (TIGR02453 family)